MELNVSTTHSNSLSPNTLPFQTQHLAEVFDVNAPIFSGKIVLQREVPMASGTTTGSLTPEINPFQYVREIKYLTL